MSQHGLFTFLLSFCAVLLIIVPVALCICVGCAFLVGLFGVPCCRRSRSQSMELLVPNAVHPASSDLSPRSVERY